LSVGKKKGDGSDVEGRGGAKRSPLSGRGRGVKKGLFNSKGGDNRGGGLVECLAPTWLGKKGTLGRGKK